MDIELRDARQEDMSVCADILNEWINETDWMPRIHSNQDVIKHYEHTIFKERQITLVEIAAKVAAFMAVSADNFVTALYISKPYRRLRIGSKLIAYAKKKMPAGIRLWTFQHNEEARQFYKKHSFTEILRTDGDNDEKLPDILLEWTPNLTGAIA